MRALSGSGLPCGLLLLIVFALSNSEETHRTSDETAWAFDTELDTDDLEMRQEDETPNWRREADAIIMLQDSVELEEGDDNELEAWEDVGMGQTSPTASPTDDGIDFTMDDAQMEEVMAARAASAAARTAAAVEMMENRNILRANESDHALADQHELALIQANYSHVIAEERWRLEEPYIEQAAQLIAGKFQEAAVEQQALKITSDFLESARNIRLENLDFIATQTKHTFVNNTRTIIEDFVHSAMQAAENAPTPEDEINSAANPSEEDATLQDMVLLDMADGKAPVPVSKNQAEPSVVETEEAQTGGVDVGEAQTPAVMAPDPGTNPAHLTAVVTNIVMKVANEKLGVPFEPVILSPIENWNCTDCPNPYTSILDIGRDTTSGQMAYRSLVAKVTANKLREKRIETQYTWNNEIKSKVNLKSRTYIESKENITTSLLHEGLRQQLNLDPNQTNARIDEHLIENKAAATTVKGRRIVFEYTKICEEQRYTSSVLEKAKEALGERMENEVLPQLVLAYTPKVEYEEKRNMYNAAHFEAKQQIDGRLDLLADQLARAASMRQAAETVVQAALDSITAREAGVQAQIDQKVMQVFTYVQDYGTAELNTKMTNAMNALRDAQREMANGDRDAIGRAAAAQVELDEAIAMASASIGGSVGSDLMALKIQIDALASPPVDLAAAAADSVAGSNSTSAI